MNNISFPPGFRLMPLDRSLPRSRFRSGDPAVDDWLATKALQHQAKHLSATKVLLNEADEIAGYYTLATSQVDFKELPAEIVKRLPRRTLPVAVLAWLGVSESLQGQGIGHRLLASALRDCYEAGRTFAFVAVILDCLSENAKRFYLKWGFSELPGQPFRLYLSAAQLTAIMESDA